MSIRMNGKNKLVFVIYVSAKQRVFGKSHLKSMKRNMRFPLVKQRLSDRVGKGENLKENGQRAKGVQQ